MTNIIDHESFLDPSRLKALLPPKEGERQFCHRCLRLEGWIRVQVAGEKSPRLMRCIHENVVSARVTIGPSGDRHKVLVDVLPHEPAGEDTDVYTMADVIREAQRRWPEKFGPNSPRNLGNQIAEGLK